MVLILTLMVGIIVSMDSEPQNKSTTTSNLSYQEVEVYFSSVKNELLCLGRAKTALISFLRTYSRVETKHRIAQKITRSTKIKIENARKKICSIFARIESRSKI